MSTSNTKNNVKVYGIGFVPDNKTSMKINIKLADNSTAYYIPKKIKKNIYFLTPVEATKVVNYFNSLNDGRVYSMFSTHLTSLQFAKKMCTARKDFLNNYPATFYRATGFRIVASADKYLESLQAQEKTK